MTRTVAGQFAGTLVAAGVKRIYGVVGDSLNRLTDALRHKASSPPRQDRVGACHARRAVDWTYAGLNPDDVEGWLTSPYERVLTTTVDQHRAHSHGDLTDGPALVGAWARLVERVPNQATTEQNGIS